MSELVLGHLEACGLAGRRRWSLIDGRELVATVRSARFTTQGEPITLELDEVVAYRPRVTVPWRAVVTISEVIP